jgi:hypothetical protein
MTGYFSRSMALAVALGAGLLAAGCGADDVELNGKIFDAMGVSGAQKSRSDDAKIAARSGIVIPPNTGSLPEPGSGRSVETEADLAFINDPDRKQAVDKVELARRQAAYCKEHYELPKARGDNSVDSVVGPAGPCRATFLSAMKKWTGGEAGEDDDK